MNKRIGVRSSPFLLVTRIVTFLLFLVLLGSVFMMYDGFSFSGLSDKNKEELLKNEGFRATVIAVDYLSKDGYDIADIDKISHFTYVVGKGIDGELYNCIGVFGGDDKFYFSYTTEKNKLSVITSEKYSQNQATVYSGKMTKYTSLEIDYIRELVKNEKKKESLLADWRRETLEKRKDINLLRGVISSVRGNSSNITFITTKLLEGKNGQYQYYAKVDFSNSQSECFAVINGIHGFTTEEAFYMFGGEKMTYDLYDVEILLKKAGSNR